MKTSGRSEEAAAKDANRALLKLGKYNGTITEVSEYVSDRGNETFKAIVEVAGRTFTDYLTDTELGGLKLRHCCASRGVLAKFDAGLIEASDLPGPVRVKIGIEKGKRGFRDRNVILDYEAVDSSVVNLRARRGETMIATRKLAALAFMGGATLALLGGCVPATSNQPVPPSYSYAPPQMVQPAYEQVPEWFWHQSPAAPVITQAAPAPQPAPRKRLDPDAVAGNPPPHASPLPAQPPPSDDPDCRSWWDLCHFI